MGRTYPSSEKQEKKGLNPIWRGVGCLTLVGLLAGGYALAGWFVGANATHQWLYLPPELSGPNWVNLPDTLGGPRNFPWLYAKVAAAVLFAVFGFSIFTLVYGIVNPVRPGEFDAPPQPPVQRRRNR